MFRRNLQISFFIVFLFFFVPLIIPFHTYPLTSFYSEWIFIVIALSLILFLFYHFTFIDIPVYCFPLLLFGIFILIQPLFLNIQIFQWNILGFLYILLTVIIISIFYTVRYLKSTLLKYFAIAMIFGALINCLFITAQMQDGEGDLIGAIGQRNQLTNYLVLAIVSCIYLYYKNRIELDLCITLSILFFIFMLILGSRLMWVYTFIFALFLLKSTNIKYLIYGIISLTLLLLLLSVLSIPNSFERLIHELITFESDGIRITLFRDGIQKFLSSPILGNGFGEYSTNIIIAMDTSRILKQFAYHTHNLFIQILTDSGIIGLGLFLIFLLSIRLTLATKEDKFIATILGVIFIYSMVEFPLWYSYFLGICAFALAFTTRTYYVQFQLTRKIKATIMTILFVFLGYTFYHLYEYKEMENLAYYPLKRSDVKVINGNNK